MLEEEAEESADPFAPLLTMELSGASGVGLRLLWSHGMGESKGVDADEAESDDSEELEAERPRIVKVVSPPRGWVMEGCSWAEGRVERASSGGKSDWLEQTRRHRCTALAYFGREA